MVPYPTDTRAFLYYSMSPEKPRIAGELRLRVTSSCDPVSFESGSDLLRPDGRPWSRPLFSLSKYYLSLYERLREDGLIPDDLHTALATLPSKRYRYHRSNVLYTLNDTFTVDFSSSGTFFFLITEQGVKSLALFKLFSVRHENRDPRPFTGAYSSLHLSILLYWLFSWICRKCLGSIWTFHAPGARRHKDHCITISQDNHTCEVCHAPWWWLPMLSKGRRASSESS